MIGGAAFVGALWGGWTFRAQNSASTDLDLIWIRIPNLELWWLLLLTTIFGAALATLFVGFSLMRNKLLLRRSRAQVRKLEKEVHELRSLPLLGSEPGGSNLDLEDAAPAGASETAGPSRWGSRVAGAAAKPARGKI